MENQNHDWKGCVFGYDLNSFSFSGDSRSSERKVEEGVVVVKASDQVCSVSEFLPVTGKYSGEAEVKSGGVEDENVDSDKYNELLPFDLDSLEEDAPANDERLFNGLEKDMSCCYSNVYTNACPFGDINEMMSGLSVRDLIISSNVLAPSATVNSSGGSVASDHITRHIQMGHYTPPAMTGSSFRPCSGSWNITDQYTHNIHLSNQESPYAQLVDPMTTGFALSASSNPSNISNDSEINFNPWRFNEVNKNVLDMTLSRDGSLCLMDRLANGDRTETATILAAVAANVFTVIGSQYGLTLFSSLLKFCDHSQKEFLLDRIVSDPEGLIIRSQNRYGSKALAELVNHLKRSRLVHQIPSILATEIKLLLFDRCATQLVQQCLLALKPHQCQHLCEAMIECACSLALDPHRCILLYNLMDNIKGFRRTRLLHKLADNSVQLVTHPSGNYVLKRVLELEADNRIIRKISYLLRGFYKTLSMDKHGSHVVEACLQSVGIHFVMDELLKLLPQELEELACHQFGNYVIKTALQTTQRCNLPCHGQLVAALLPGMARLEESLYGKVVHKMLTNEIKCKNARGNKHYAGINIE